MSIVLELSKRKKRGKDASAPRGVHNNSLPPPNDLANMAAALDRTSYLADMSEDYMDGALESINPLSDTVPLSSLGSPNKRVLDVTMEEDEPPQKRLLLEWEHEAKLYMTDQKELNDIMAVTQDVSGGDPVKLAKLLRVYRHIANASKYKIEHSFANDVKSNMATVMQYITQMGDLISKHNSTMISIEEHLRRSEHPMSTATAIPSVGHIYSMFGNIIHMAGDTRAVSLMTNLKKEATTKCKNMDDVYNYIKKRVYNK
nr:TPA_asm: hypothetical protein [Microrhabdovirus]